MTYEEFERTHAMILAVGFLGGLALWVALLVIWKHPPNEAGERKRRFWASTAIGMAFVVGAVALDGALAANNPEHLSRYTERSRPNAAAYETPDADVFAAPSPDMACVERCTAEKNHCRATVVQDRENRLACDRWAGLCLQNCGL